VLSFTPQTTPTVGGAYSPFGEKYASYSGGANGYFAGMLGIADEGPINDAYQAEARLMHQAEGRWVSPDPAGLAAVDLTNPQTLNRYGYVANDPLNNIDPSGLLAPAPAPPPLLPPIQPWQIGGAPIPLCNPASDWSYTGTPGQTPCNPVLIQPGGPILIAQNGGGVAAGRSSKAPNNACPTGTTPHIQRMLVTGYDNSYQSTGKNPGDLHYGQTTSGAMTAYGTIAAPRTYPFGTRMYIPGYGLGTVLDRGGAIRNSHIDLWFPTTQEAINWGAQHLPVTVCR
jgi:RHS repeat-associated protein